MTVPMTFELPNDLSDADFGSDLDLTKSAMRLLEGTLLFTGLLLFGLLWT